MGIELCKKRIGMVSFAFLWEIGKRPRKENPEEPHKKKSYIDFWIFLVYNSTMISQVIVRIDRQAAGPIMSRSKLR